MPGRTKGGAYFTLAVLAFEQYEVRAITHQGEPWFMLHDLQNIIHGLGDDGCLPARDVLVVDPDQIKKGWTRLATRQGAAHFVSEVGVAELCFSLPSILAKELGRWILREAGPFLHAAGLMEVRAGQLPIVDHKIRVAEAEPVAERAIPHVLYRFFDGEGTLLYVGISRDARQRMAGHRSTQPWWDLAARIEFERYPDFAGARAAELAAIAAEDPIFNRADRGTVRS